MRFIAFASDLEHRSLRNAFFLTSSRVIKSLSNSSVLTGINSEERAEFICNFKNAWQFQTDFSHCSILQLQLCESGHESWDTCTNSQAREN